MKNVIVYLYDQSKAGNEDAFFYLATIEKDTKLCKDLNKAIEFPKENDKMLVVSDELMKSVSEKLKGKSKNEWDFLMSIRKDHMYRPVNNPYRTMLLYLY